MLVRGDIPYALAAAVNIKPQPIKTGLYSTCFPQQLLKMYGSYRPYVYWLLLGVACATIKTGCYQPA